MISHKDSRFASGRTFEIVEPLRQIVGIENDRRDANRPGERPAPDLVDARDPSMAACERLALEVEVGRDRQGRRGAHPSSSSVTRRSQQIGWVCSSASYRSRRAAAKMMRRKRRWKRSQFITAGTARIKGSRIEMETPNPLLEHVATVFAAVPGVVAVVLGGSRASGAAHSASDYDIGLYFRESAGLDVGRLLEAAKGLVDDPGAAAVTEVGG